MREHMVDYKDCCEAPLSGRTGYLEPRPMELVEPVQLPRRYRRGRLPARRGTGLRTPGSPSRHHVGVRGPLQGDRPVGAEDDAAGVNASSATSTNGAGRRRSPRARRWCGRPESLQKTFGSAASVRRPEAQGSSIPDAIGALPRWSSTNGSDGWARTDSTAAAKCSGRNIRSKGSPRASRAERPRWTAGDRSHPAGSASARAWCRMPTSAPRPTCASSASVDVGSPEIDPPHDAGHEVLGSGVVEERAGSRRRR